MRETLAEVFALVIGWLFCTGFLIGIYHLCRSVGAHFDLGEEPLIIGLTGAISLAWVYTHSSMQDNVNRLSDRITRLERGG